MIPVVDDRIVPSHTWDVRVCTHKPCLHRRLFMRILKYCIRKGRWKWQNLKKQTKFCKKVLRSRDWSAVSTPRKVKETVSALSTYPDIPIRFPFPDEFPNCLADGQGDFQGFFFVLFFEVYWWLSNNLFGFQFATSNSSTLLQPRVT